MKIPLPGEYPHMKGAVQAAVEELETMGKAVACRREGNVLPLTSLTSQYLVVDGFCYHLTFSRDGKTGKVTAVLLANEFGLDYGTR